MTAAAIVVAGGQGTRMGARVNKVFMEVDGRSILEHSLDLFESNPLVDQIVLVARQAEIPREFYGGAPLNGVIAGDLGPIVD